MGLSANRSVTGKAWAQSVAPGPEHAQQHAEPPGHELSGRDLEVSGRKCRINTGVLAEHGAHDACIDFDTQSRLQGLPCLQQLSKELVQIRRAVRTKQSIADR